MNSKELHKQDLKGQIFGRLTVLEYSGTKTTVSNRAAFWLCRCECGKIIETRRDSLLSGNTVSCGCINKGLTRKKRYPVERFSLKEFIQNIKTLLKKEL